MEGTREIERYQKTIKRNLKGKVLGKHCDFWTQKFDYVDGLLKVYIKPVFQFFILLKRDTDSTSLPYRPTSVSVYHSLSPTFPSLLRAQENHVKHVKFGDT